MILKNYQTATAFTAGDETLIREVLHPRNEGLELNYSLAHATLEAGRASLPHVLGKRSETYVIQEGAGRAFIAGQAVDVRPGDVLYIPEGAEQYIANTGPGPLKFWCIVSPPWSKEDEWVELEKGRP
ncbi:MAG: cupin domain-containing protein [Phaeodactylibacter sp.]|nr:cupin domain-containing protein [Phaeodactylibacter sp.]MCB9274735.1 cupin domain-containing protein [Lewinellaceae bacterium]